MPQPQNTATPENNTHLNLAESLVEIDYLQAKRFNKLSGKSLEIAFEGINRHLKACRRMDVNPDPKAVREIIDDALDDRAMFRLVNQDLLTTEEVVA